MVKKPNNDLKSGKKKKETENINIFSDFWYVNDSGVHWMDRCPLSQHQHKDARSLYVNLSHNISSTSLEKTFFFFCLSSPRAWKMCKKDQTNLHSSRLQRVVCSYFHNLRQKFHLLLIVFCCFFRMKR